MLDQVSQVGMIQNVVVMLISNTLSRGPIQRNSVSWLADSENILNILHEYLASSHCQFISGFSLHQYTSEMSHLTTCFMANRLVTVFQPWSVSTISRIQL